MIPIPPPTERCRKVVKKLEILCLLELLLSIVSLYVSYDLFFYMLFSALILYLGYTQLDFCSMMYFIFFTIIQLFDLLLIFASVWGAEVSQQTMALVIILDVLLVVFNIIALVIGCEAYKEFKLVALEAERDLFGRGGFGFGGPGFGPGYGPSAGPRYRYGGVGKKNMRLFVSIANFFFLRP